MTNSKLIEKLQALPADMEVMLIQWNDESAYGMVEAVGVNPVRFQAEDVPQNEWPTIDCIVISDEI